jgi:hypothetical protein
MSKPKPRELDAVSKLPVLNTQEVATLYQILGALGFDFETIVLFMEKTDKEVRTLFRVDEASCHKPANTFLTGRDLAWWCDLVRLRPGVIQQRLNFDESNLRLKKQGRSSTRVPAGWVGPPLFAIKGSVTEGRAFVELASLVALPAGSALHAAKLGQMAEGKFPLRLPQLRDLMKGIEEAAIVHPKIDIIRSALDQFPEGVRTPEEVLAALTQQEEEREAKPETVVVSKEEPVQVVIVSRFQAELARRGLLPVLRKLHESSAEVRDICHSWSIDLGGEIFPGHFEVLVGSREFELASQTFPELSSPLRELGEWLALERQLETEKKPEKKLPAPGKGLESPVASLPQPRALSETTVPKAVAPVVSVPVKVAVDRRPVTSTLISQGEVPARARTVEKDAYGVGWDFERQQVILGPISIPLVPVYDVRLEGSTRTASKRTYDTLYAIRNAYKLDWDTFCAHLSMQKSWFSDLLTSKSQLNEVVLHNILDGLRKHYKLTLTPAELFGLAPLTLEVAEKVPDGDVGGAKVELAFPLGDVRLGLMCSMMLRKYTAIRRWFEKTYGLTAEHLKQLENGQLGIPLAVYHVLMDKVKERIDSVEGIQLPIVYRRLIALPQSEPVKNGEFRLDETAIPGRNWLQ